MNGRPFTTPLWISTALCALCAAAWVAGVREAGAVAAGLGVATANLAAMRLIVAHIAAPDADPGSRILWAVAAALKFMILAGIVYAAIAGAGLDPALFAAGFGAALCVVVAWLLLDAHRSSGAAGTTQKGHAACRTE
jgi:hypothetical protein